LADVAVLDAAIDDAASDGSIHRDGSSSDAMAHDGSAPGDAGMISFDAGCGSHPPMRDGGPLPITNISFVSGSTSLTVDLSPTAPFPDGITLDFQLHFDNETGAPETLCITNAHFGGMVLTTNIDFAVDPPSFSVPTNLSTFQASKIPGSAVIQNIFDVSAL